MPARKITYELKLKNIKYLLYGKKGPTELGQEVRYYIVRQETISDTKFLLRHFGRELLPGIDSATRHCLTDLMGRDGIENPWRQGSVGFVDGFCSKIREKGAAGTYQNVDALVERNKTLFEEREGPVLSASLGDYIVHIREAESEVDADNRIPGPQLDLLLGYAEGCLTAYVRKKDTRYLVMALSWLLIGALVRTKITGLSNVLEYYRKALRWDEVGAIPKEQVLGSREQGLEKDVAAGLCRKLRARLEEERDSHPSFRLMNDAYGLDRELIPRGSLLIPVSGRVAELDEGRKDGTEPGADTNGGKGPGARTLADFIRESRQPGRRKHVTIEGEGGIGKTVALLSLALEPGIFPEGVPVIYVPLHRLNQPRFDPKDGKGRLDQFIDSCLKKECLCTDGEAVAFHELRRQDGPGAVLLLDGYNEVLEGLKRQVRMEINEWAAFPGVQIITTSRTSWSCGDDFMMIRLRPLDNDTIRRYLERTGAEVPRPGDSLWRVIDYPLMLTLYTHISAVRRLAGKGLSAGVSEGSPGAQGLSWRTMNRAGDIIWNYLQKELARCTVELDVGTDDSFLEACAVAILHTAPYIAWRMSRGDAFSIPLEEEGAGEGRPSFAALVRESIVCLGNAWHWPVQLKGIINEQGRRRRWIRLAGEPDTDKLFDRAERIERLLLNEVSLFRVREDGGGDGDGPGRSSIEVEMMHQQFRDGLAAIWLCQRIGSMETPAVLEKGIFGSTGDKYALPLSWREKVGRYALKFAAEIMDERGAGLFWEAGRAYQPSDVRFAYTMLNLMSERSVRNGVHENDFRNLDFSGMDLRDISLFYYRKEGSPKLQLPHREDPGRMSGTALARASLESQGHDGSIESVSISGDGKRAVSGGSDGTVRVWNLESMTCEKELNGHTGEICSVSISGDGKHAVSGGSDGNVRVWNLESMTCVKVLEGHEGVVKCVSISRDGKRAVSGGKDGLVRVWGLESLTLEKELSGHTGMINTVSISEDGKRAASGGKDGHVRVWNLWSMVCEIELEGYWKCVALSGNGKRAVIGGYNELLVWNIGSQTCEMVKMSRYVTIDTVSTSRDGKRILIVGEILRNKRLRPRESYVAMWNLENMTCEKEMGGHGDGNPCVALSGDGNRAVIGRLGGEGGSMYVWNCENMTCEKVLEGRKKKVASVSVCGDGKRLVSGGEDGLVRVWNLSSMTCEKVLEGHKSCIWSVSVSEDGKRAMTGGDDGIIRFWDFESMTCKRELEGHTGMVYSVSLSEDGGVAVSGGEDGIVRAWNLGNKVYKKELGRHSKWGGSDTRIFVVAVSGNGKRAVSGGVDGLLYVWNLKRIACEKELKIPSNTFLGTVWSASISRDGKRAVSGYIEGNIRVWNLEHMTCEKDFEGHMGYGVTCVSVSEDGNRAVSVGEDNMLRVWNLEKMVCEKEVKVYQERTQGVSISGDGKRAVSGGYNGTVRVWDLDNMICEKELFALPGIDIVGVDFSCANIESEETREILRQNGAVV